MSDLTFRLQRWAAARDRRNGSDGFGKTGTRLLVDAADALAALERENQTLRDALAYVVAWLRYGEGDEAAAAEMADAALVPPSGPQPADTETQT